MTTLIHEEKQVTTRIMTKTAPPAWLLAFWKEIDNKTFGKGFECFAGGATATLASPIGMDASRFAKICVPSSTPALLPSTMLLNIGMADRSRYSGAR